MRSFFSVLGFVLVALIARPGTCQNPSQGPNCFRCPPEDQLGFAVAQKDENSNPIFCSYPAVEGEDPNDFFCTYSFVGLILIF